MNIFGWKILIGFEFCRFLNIKILWIFLEEKNLNGFEIVKKNLKNNGLIIIVN